MMKAASPELLALFATNLPFEQCDLYTIRLSSGYVLRYSTCGFDVVSGGHTFLCSRTPGGVVIDAESDSSGPRGKWSKGLDVGTWSVQVMPRKTDLIGDNNWLWAVRAGILTEATAVVDRAYFYTWPDFPVLSIVPIGTVNVFAGRIAEVDLGRSAVQISMNDPRELLAINMPRNLYTGGCRLALFDSMCGLNKDTFGVVVSAVDAQLNIVTMSATAPDGYYDLGNALFTSGRNAQLRMMIRSQAGPSLQLMAPFPFAVTAGDMMIVYPGCDKTQATCAGKFNNLLNYGGAPYIPSAETAV